VNGWIAVDLDGTLAHYEGWKGETHIGAPIPKMVARVKAWLAEGKEVKIFTARAYCPDDATMEVKEARSVGITCIKDWCEEHIGQRLEVTNIKDYAMIELWDDRAVQVVLSTGLVVGGRE
jgi:hypothetical protein